MLAELIEETPNIIFPKHRQWVINNSVIIYWIKTLGLNNQLAKHWLGDFKILNINKPAGGMQN
jgi:hypothetical protein